MNLTTSKTTASALLALENIRQLDLEPFRYLLQAPKGNALLLIFEAKQSGCSDANFTGKLGVGHLPALLAKELTELAIKTTRHMEECA